MATSESRNAVSKQKASHLRSNCELILHTKIANRLFSSKWQVGYLGLVQFASAVSRLWQACKLDDPYAEWTLLKLYDDIYDLKDKLQQHEIALQAQLNQLRGLNVSVFTSTSPFKYDLQFQTPFAYLAAILIEQIDYLIRLLLTIKRLGIVPDKRIVINTLIKELQAVFAITFSWQKTAITRQDIHENNEKAQFAEATFGKVPLKLLHREIQFTFFPKLEVAAQ